MIDEKRWGRTLAGTTPAPWREPYDHVFRFVRAPVEARESFRVRLGWALRELKRRTYFKRRDRDVAGAIRELHAAFEEARDIDLLTQEKIRDLLTRIQDYKE